MALPFLSPTARRRMDPRDTLDIYVVVTQGDGVRDVLQTGEEITSFTVTLTPEAGAAGLLISEGDAKPRYAGLVFAFQLRVDPAFRDSGIFAGTGFIAGIEVTFATNLEDREKQYTVGVRVVNK